MVQSTNQIMDAYIGEIVGGMIRDAASWKAQALALSAENAALKEAVAKLQQKPSEPPKKEADES